MEYITLKNSDLKVSRLCMGCCPMGGYGWGAVHESELIDAVNSAVYEGINFFDTADTYGLGASERTLGKALGTRRKDVIIASKFGVRVGKNGTEYDNSPSWIRQALDRSLERLGTDYLDLYQIHYRDGKTPMEEVAGTLQELRKEGKIRWFGISNIHRDDIDELLPFRGQLVSFQDEYSLACRKNEKDMFLLREELGMTPMTWGSLGQGILTGKYTIDNAIFDSDDRRSRDIYVNFHGEKLVKNLQIVELLKEIAAVHNKPVPAVAIRFILDYIPDSVVLCGVKRQSQMKDNAAGIGWHLNKEEILLLDEESR